MTKSAKILIIGGVCLLLFPKLVHGKPAFISKIDPAQRQDLFNVYKALVQAGFTGMALQLAIVQVLHETGNFTRGSSVFRNNNNATGIIWINKPYQKNATRGTKLPKKEGFYYYARFDTLQDWARDFKRILSLKDQPIKAPDVSSYVARLAKNGYFYPNTGTAFTNYLNSLQQKHRNLFG